MCIVETPLPLTVDGEKLQVVSARNPVQLSDTGKLKPVTGTTEIVKDADSPV